MFQPMSLFEDTKYSICILFDLNSRPNSVFILGRIAIISTAPSTLVVPAFSLIQLMSEQHNVHA